MNPTANSIFSPYLLSRFHQHLSHLNDMAFAHTKILQEIMEKHSNEPITSSPRGSMSSSSSSSSSTVDSIQQRKRAYPSMDNHEMKNENHRNKRPRKQSKPQHLLQSDPSKLDGQSSSSEEEREEEEMGEVIEPIGKQVRVFMLRIFFFAIVFLSPSNFQTSPSLPFPSNNIPFLNYIQELARTNNLNSPVLMGQFLDNLTNESRRIPFPPPPPTPPSASSLFPPTIPPLPLPPPSSSSSHSHAYLSQILFNAPLLSSSPAFNRFIPLSSHPSNPFHFSTPKKRRTKVNLSRSPSTILLSLSLTGHWHSSISSNGHQNSRRRSDRWRT